MKKTALNIEHKKLKAKMVDFAGWEMPIQYAGIIEEHKAVRDKAGIFDVSHMCVLDIIGVSAFEFLQFVTVNDVSKLKINCAQYSMILDEDGDVLDDIIVTKVEEGFRLVINSSNAEKIKDWFKNILRKKSFSLNLDYREDISIIALQGPDSKRILEEIFAIELKLNSFSSMQLTWQQENIFISRTGYTGELGFEVFISNQKVSELWKIIIEKGAVPCGLGARDTLRIEAGLPLYGKEIYKGITAYDMGYGWIVSLNKGDFIGKKRLEEATKKKRLYGCLLEEKGVLRDGYEIVGHGTITSGTFSPTLNSAIGMFYSNSDFQENEKISVIIRGKQINAKVTQLPFIKKR